MKEIGLRDLSWAWEGLIEATEIVGTVRHMPRHANHVKICFLGTTQILYFFLGRIEHIALQFE